MSDHGCVEIRDLKIVIFIRNEWITENKDPFKPNYVFNGRGQILTFSLFSDH